MTKCFLRGILAKKNSLKADQYPLHVTWSRNIKWTRTQEDLGKEACLGQLNMSICTHVTWEHSLPSSLYNPNPQCSRWWSVRWRSTGATYTGCWDPTLFQFFSSHFCHFHLQLTLRLWSWWDYFLHTSCEPPGECSHWWDWFQVAAFSQRGLRGEVTLSQEGSAVKVLNIDPDHDPPVYFSSWGLQSRHLNWRLV